MKNYFLSFLFLPIFYSTSFAQVNNPPIKGYILSAEDNNPIPFTSIGISSKNIGTITNESGYFELKISTFSSKDTLVCSSLGYKSVKLPLAQLSLDRINNIKLVPFVLQLKEIEVLSNVFTPIEIIKQASKRLDQNLEKEPYLADAFYRELNWKNSEPNSFTEGFGEFYNGGHFKKHSKSKNRFLTYDAFIFNQLRSNHHKAVQFRSLKSYKKEI
ncbi:MAG: carboxypeptidase-like regulatory domain-containing protein, partial [Flammeovirgaceae bacterium]|nr:carboxypeptidase-like regulatory domain-containing protein [Flammeovirgaceae bacterium]